MKPKSQETSGQIDLFNTPLADLLNPKHELYQLANLIDWKVLDRGTEYCGKVEQHDYQLYLAINDIDHTKTKAMSPQTGIGWQ
jgi:hypothetical protein